MINVPVMLFHHVVQVASAETGAIAVACGYSHSIFLTKTGEVPQKCGRKSKRNVKTSRNIKKLSN